MQSINRTMARTKLSRNRYGAVEWARKRVGVFSDPKTGLFLLELVRERAQPHPVAGAPRIEGRAGSPASRQEPAQGLQEANGEEPDPGGARRGVLARLHRPTQDLWFPTPRGSVDNPSNPGMSIRDIIDAALLERSLVTTEVVLPGYRGRLYLRPRVSAGC